MNLKKLFNMDLDVAYTDILVLGALNTYGKAKGLRNFG